jgi:hypothetical protein
MTAGINELRLLYKKAVDDWVAAIRAEEALATTDHSMTSMEHWDAAHFREQDAQKKATDAREGYKEALRSANYGIYTSESKTSFKSALIRLLRNSELGEGGRFVPAIVR